VSKITFVSTCCYTATLMSDNLYDNFSLGVCVFSARDAKCIALDCFQNHTNINSNVILCLGLPSDLFF